ncbi:MAG TPA: hypothetical protein PLE42_04975 [Candidatus Competibacteraceae bacterium]|nr:hypothetical protein [Candidatus Competibacteraceae bacterium]
MPTPERSGREAAFTVMILHARNEWLAQSRNLETRRDRTTLRHLAKIHNRLLRQSGMHGHELEER